MCKYTIPLNLPALHKISYCKSLLVGFTDLDMFFRYQRSTTTLSIGNLVMHDLFFEKSFHNIIFNSFSWSNCYLISFHFSAAPICYAHLAASQMSQFINFEELPETSSERGTITSSGSLSIPELPRLHKDVNGSMFFCWGSIFSYIRYIWLNF